MRDKGIVLVCAHAKVSAETVIVSTHKWRYLFPKGIIDALVLIVSSFRTRI